MIYTELTKLAIEVRTWAERYGEANCFSSDLLGMCAISTNVMVYELQARGVNAVAVINKYVTHAFTMVDDLVVDVTATQFSNGNNGYYDGVTYPAVLIQAHSTLPYHWHIGTKYKSLKEFRNRLDCWGSHKPKDLTLAY